MARRNLPQRSSSQLAADAELGDPEAVVAAQQRQRPVPLRRESTGRAGIVVAQAFVRQLAEHLLLLRIEIADRGAELRARLQHAYARALHGRVLLLRDPDQVGEPGIVEAPPPRRILGRGRDDPRVVGRASQFCPREPSGGTKSGPTLTHPATARRSRAPRPPKAPDRPSRARAAPRHACRLRRPGSGRQAIRHSDPAGCPQPSTTSSASSAQTEVRFLLVLSIASPGPPHRARSTVMLVREPMIVQCCDRHYTFEP